MSPRRTTPVGTMFSTVLVTALVAAALDAEGLRVWAERLEFGAGRTAALALAEKWAGVGETLGSTAARASLVKFAASWTAEPGAAQPADAPPGAEPMPAEPTPAEPSEPAPAVADAEPVALAPPEEPDAGVALAAVPLAEPPLVRLRGGPVAGRYRDAGTPSPGAVAAIPAVAAADAGITPVAAAAVAIAPAPPTPAVAQPAPAVATSEVGPFAPLHEPPDPKQGEATTYGPKDGKTVLLLGDSMIGSALGTELVRELLKRGGFRVVTAWQPATGLSRGDFFDWGPRMTALMARHKPSIVVVTLGTNDGQDLRGPGKKPVYYGSAGWGPGYERLVKASAERLTRGGATLYWLELPPMRPPIFAKAAREVNLRVKNALVGMPRATRVPVPPLLMDESGGFTDRSRTSPSFAARASDGVHWSQKSGRYFAEELMKRIAPGPVAAGGQASAAAAVE